MVSHLNNFILPCNITSVNQIHKSGACQMRVHAGTAGAPPDGHTGKPAFPVIFRKHGLFLYSRLQDSLRSWKRYVYQIFVWQRWSVDSCLRPHNILTVNPFRARPGNRWPPLRKPQCRQKRALRSGSPVSL